MNSCLKLPFRINFCNLTEIRHPNGPVKHIRRVQQAPYPLVKASPDVHLFGLLESIDVPKHNNNINSTNIQQQQQSQSHQVHSDSSSHKSKKLFPNFVKSKHHHAHAATTNENTVQSTSSPSSSSTSANLARQFFHNLNIFSHKPSHNQQQRLPTHSEQQVPDETSSAFHSGELKGHVRRGYSKHGGHSSSTNNLLMRRSRRSYRSQEELYLETDGGSSCCSLTTSSGGGVGSRRPSIDTVSTYLSHDSNEILHYNSSNDGGAYSGDDDVFLPPRKVAGSIVGVDADSESLSRFVSVIEPPKWPNCVPCAMCLEELQYDLNNPAVSLIRCEHLMHLNCLNHLILSQSEEQKKTQNGKLCSLYIECPVCGIIYGEKYGNQPSGTMSWSIIPKQLAGHEGQNTIQIVYK